MSEPQNIENRVKEIQSVCGEEEANRLLHQGWIYLGFYRAYYQNDIADKHKTEQPTFVLGRV